MKKIIVTFTFAALTNGLAAGDWPGFRGPLGNGVSDEVGLPVTNEPRREPRHISQSNQQLMRCGESQNSLAKLIKRLMRRGVSQDSLAKQTNDH